MSTSILSLPWPQDEIMKKLEEIESKLDKHIQSSYLPENLSIFAKVDILLSPVMLKRKGIANGVIYYLINGENVIFHDNGTVVIGGRLKTGTSIEAKLKEIVPIRRDMTNGL